MIILITYEVEIDESLFHHELMLNLGILNLDSLTILIVFT